MSVTRHWLVLGKGDDDETFVVWDEDALHGYKIDGPFVLEAEQPPGAVSLADVCEFLRSATYPDPACGSPRHVSGWRSAAVALEREFGGAVGDA